MHSFVKLLPQLNKKPLVSSLFLQQKKTFCSWQFFEQASTSYERDPRGKYVPKEPLIFKNNLCKIYEYTIYNPLSKAYLAILAAAGLLSAYFIGKIINFRERGFFGFVFFGMGATLLTPKVYSLAAIYSRIIHKIYLTKSGTSVFVKHAKYGFLPTTTKYKISDISRPLDPELAISVIKFAYPVVFKDKLLYLPRDTDFMNQDVLPAVLNGIEINTQENDNNQFQPDEIIIE